MKFDDMDARIQSHIIKNVLKPSGLEENEINKEMMATAWFNKEEAFTSQLSTLGMAEADTLSADEKKAALALTFSGSLIGIGPMEGKHRQVIYSSIGMRRDVPNQAVSDNSSLDSDLKIGEEAHFSGGPIVKSSPLYKIAVIQDEILTIEDQRQTISEATRIITEEFVDVNKTVIID
ncbi:MAG: hypothetical protein JXA95_09105 [Spirochaetales bacterium]|nr:hypothetical protein [Spirochaetales bacterium]